MADTRVVRWPLIAAGLLVVSLAAPHARAEPRTSWYRDVSFQQRLPGQARAAPPVELLRDGIQALKMKGEAIKKADLIIVSTYMLEADSVGNGMVALLQQRAEAGAQVYVQCDFQVAAPPSARLRRGWSRGAVELLPPHLRQLVAHERVTLIPAAPPGHPMRLFGRHHEKMLVTWKKGQPAEGFVGGRNIGEPWAIDGDPKRLVHGWGVHGLLDAEVRLQGEVVGDLIDRFLETARRYVPPTPGARFWAPWLGRRGRSAAAAAEVHRKLEELQQTRSEMAEGGAFRFDAAPETQVDVRLLGNHPSGKGSQAQRQPIAEVLAKLLDEVPPGELVRISQAFFAPVGRVDEALRSALERGVEIELLLNSDQGVDAETRYLSRTARGYLRKLWRELDDPSRLKAHEWHGDRARGLSSIHQKLAIFGRQEGPVVIGSSNLDALSLEHNSETAVVIDDPKLHAELQAFFELDIQHRPVVDVSGVRRRQGATPLGPEVLAQDPYWQQLFQGLLNRVRFVL